MWAEGLSPLARGSPDRGLRQRDLVGPIPARAGQPRDYSLIIHGAAAYPRSRGAALIKDAEDDIEQGLSPLARGSRHRRTSVADSAGPIPARAGQPRTCGRRSTPIRAYPRSRGAARLTSPIISVMGGLSPLARGSPGARRCRHRCRGPIPARAGQPSGSKSRRRVRRAYPRSRGAAEESQLETKAIDGLSPLARGSLLHLTHCGARENLGMTSKF